MKSYRFRLILVALAALTGFLLMSCDKVEALTDSVVGTWNLASIDMVAVQPQDAQETLTFKMNQTWKLTKSEFPDSTDFGKWSRKESKYICQQDRTNFDTVYTMSKEKKSLTKLVGSVTKVYVKK